MAKKNRHARKAKLVAQNISSQKENVPAVVTNLQQQQISKTSTKEPDLANETVFGFDDVCGSCRELYVSKMSTAKFEWSQDTDYSLSLGNVSHIQPASKCKTCRAFFSVRWTTSSTQNYHLHAFSAAKLIYGRSIRILKGSLDPKSSLGFKDLQDSPVFVVLADCTEPFSAALILEKAANGRVLIAKSPSYDDDCASARVRQQKVFDEDEATHQRKIEDMHEKEYPTMAISIRQAIIKSKQTGFVYELKEKGNAYRNISWRYADTRCEPTTTAELEARRAAGATMMDRYIPIQPVDTGDQNSSEVLGYVPLSLKTEEIRDVKCVKSAGIFGQPLDSKSIDFSLVRGWLRQCKDECRLENFNSDRTRFQRIDFRVIDCKERRVIRVPSKRAAKYIALSYVWGKGDSTQLEVAELPHPLPETCAAVIEDAMTVTLRLGYRFLWVDRLCISPDGKTRHDQIANMDLVYKNAELTIVAAAGNNANYGLPGVGARPRPAQTQIAIGNHHYLATQLSPKRTLEKSVYDSRGWTYQEYFFSRRRLVFTEDQVHYECRADCTGVLQQESLLGPPRHFFSYNRPMDYIERDSIEDKFLQKLPGHRSDATYDHLGHIQNLPLPQIEKVFALQAFEHHVSEFTDRKLGYDSDALQAVTSILDRFMFQTHALYHLQGIPFIPKSNFVYWDDRAEHDVTFEYGLLWTHGPSAATLPRRRENFPTWTWAGWEGKVNWLISTTTVTKWWVEKADARFQYKPCPKSTSDAKSTKGSNGSTSGKSVKGNCKKATPKAKLRQVRSYRPSEEQAATHPAELYFEALLYRIPLKIVISTDDEDKGNSSGQHAGLDPGVYLDSTVVSTQSRLHPTQVELDPAEIKNQRYYGMVLVRAGSLRHVLVVKEIREQQEQKKQVVALSHGGRRFERVGVMSISMHWSGWTGPAGIQGWLV